jgi:5-methyltetrahydropteroyltriglutamate--homocysteine methyltransferase
MEPERGPELASLRLDHVGSLLRPQWLRDAFDRHAAGELTDDQLREAQDRAVREVIAKQEAAGLPVVTDGEYRRVSFMDAATGSLRGLMGAASAPMEAIVPGARFDSAVTERVQPMTERVSVRRNLPLEEYRFAQQVATRPVKVTILGPDRLMRRNDPGSVYATRDEFVPDVIAAYRQIVGELVAAGCRYVQLDGPEYTAYVDPPSLERMRARGEDPDENLKRAIAMDNAIIADFPGVTFGVHLCRGNRRSMYHREGSYDAIAERLFGALHYDRFLLEYDTERAGGFEPLRFLPPGRTAVLGLVTTKVSDLETADQLKRRVADAARFVDPSQLAISPQCGFSSSIQGNLLGEDDQWRKLDVLREVADDLWGGG